MAKQHRHVEIFVNFLGSGFFFGTLGIGFIIAIAWLWNSGFLEVKTIVSVGVTDLAMGYLLYLLLGQRRRADVEEAVNLMDSVQKLSHLKVYWFSDWRTRFYYIENTTTHEYFIAPDFIENMIKRGVINAIRCTNEEDMRAKLKKNGSHPNEKQATLIQLMVVEQRKKPKEKTETKAQSI